MIYEYKCRECGQEYASQRRFSAEPCTTTSCNGQIKRVFSFNTQAIMHEQYNPSVGRVISDRKQHADILKRISEERTIRTGIEHNFVPVDPADSIAVHGITEEGLDATRARQVAQGKREVKFYA